MSLSKISKFNFVTLFMVLAACLLSPLCFFVPSATSAVPPNDVASSCVIPDLPFFNPKVCPLEEETSYMFDYHYGFAVDTPSLPTFSWFSKTISTFSFSSKETLAFLSATSTSWLLDMEMKLYSLLHSSESNAIENMVEYRRSLWFTFLNVNFAEFADYWSLEMMLAFDHSLRVLQKLFLDLYATGTLTNFYYDISAWTLHLSTVILRDMPSAFFDKSSELLRSFQSSDAVALTYPGSHPTLSSIQPYLFDLLMDVPAPFITAAVINITPTGNTTDWRKTLCVASGWVGVDKSVLVSSPGFFVLHPPMFFTIRTTLDSVMAPGERNHMLAVNFNLVAIVIALLSTLAIRVMVNQVIQGVKSILLHLANWKKGASYFDSIISLELHDLPAFANHHESCESLSSLGSVSGEAMMSTLDSIPLELLDSPAYSTCPKSCAPQPTPSSFPPVCSDTVADLPVSSSDVTAAPSHLSPSDHTTMQVEAGNTDPLAKGGSLLSLRRKLHALRSSQRLRRRLRNLRQYRLQASRKKALLSELFLLLSSDSFANFLRPVSSADVTADPSPSEKTTQWNKAQGVAVGTTTWAAGKSTKHRLATKALMKDIRSRHRIGNFHMHAWLRFSLGEVPTAASYESNRFRLAVQSPEKAVSIITSSGDLSNQTKPVLYQLERDVVFWMFRSRLQEAKGSGIEWECQRN